VSLRWAGISTVGPSSCRCWSVLVSSLPATVVPLGSSSSVGSVLVVANPPFKAAQLPSSPCCLVTGCDCPWVVRGVVVAGSAAGAREPWTWTDSLAGYGVWLLARQRPRLTWFARPAWACWRSWA